jgi:hypothetical protein
MTTAKKKPVKGPNGGARRGAGRPKGSKNINSQDSVKKLEELKFDPITEMVSMVEAIDKDLLKTHVDKNGATVPTIRLGSGAHAQLMATRGTLINNLMRYGYRPVVEKTETEDLTDKTMKINFSFNKEEESP